MAVTRHYAVPLMACMAVALALGACGGGKGNSTTAPSTITRADIAPTVGRIVAETTTQLFNSAGSQSAENVDRPPMFLSRLLQLLSVPTVFAQSRVWTRLCPAGGSATMQLSPFVKTTTVSNVPIVYASCAANHGTTKVTTNGQPVVNGTWWTTDTSKTNMRVTGDFSVDCAGCEPFIGATLLDGTVDGSGSYIGMVGGTLVTTTPSMPSPTPTPTPTPAPTPTPTPTPRPTTTPTPTPTPPSTTFLVTPAVLDLGRINFCGGSASGTFTITTASDVTWTIIGYPFVEIYHSITFNRYSGTGSGTATVTIRHSAPGGCRGEVMRAVDWAVEFQPSRGSSVVVVIRETPII